MGIFSKLRRLVPKINLHLLPTTLQPLLLNHLHYPQPNHRPWRTNTKTLNTELGIRLHSLLDLVFWDTKRDFSKPNCDLLIYVLGGKMEPKKGDGRHCELCGSSSPKVRCEKCLNQIFCLSCDDMYHRHPKRMNHTRKVLSYLKMLSM